MAETDFWEVVGPYTQEFRNFMRQCALNDTALRNVGRLLLNGREIGPKTFGHLLGRMEHLYGVEQEETEFLLTVSMAQSLEADEMIHQALEVAL